MRVCLVRCAALLFLPLYSPDLNSIEHDFSALKRNREYHERVTLDEIVNAINGYGFVYSSLVW